MGEGGARADEARRVDDARRAVGGAATAVRPATTSAQPKGGRRLPDLAALPPLLAATGSFASLRERLGRAGDPLDKRGRHGGLTSVPHGAKSFLAAALALADPPERVVWVARDAEIGDRVAEELGAWLGDPDAVAVLEPRSALAYERSELVADETAARVAALAAWRTGRARILVASVQALLQRTLDPTDLPAEPRVLAAGTRIGLDALLHELLDLGYQPTLEVAGRGEFARRGGIVDVFPPGESLPVRIDFFGDEVDSIRRFDPTDQRTVGTAESATLLPASEFLVPAGGPGELRARLGRAAARLPERLAADLARFEGTEPGPTGPADERLCGGDARPRPRDACARRRRRRRGLGRRSSARRPGWTMSSPARSSSSTSPATSPSPARSCGARPTSARPTSSRPATCRRTGRRPTSRRATGRPGCSAARTLELTWESEPSEAIAGGGLSSGDLFGWREPSVPGLRAGRMVEAVEALGRGPPADRPRLRPGGPAVRGARARPVDRSPPSAGSRPRRRPARSPSSSGA